MNGENINSERAKMRVLVAPLDWGLGHATRCIPLIKELIISGFEVIIASDAATDALLKAEFPHLQFLLLPGYSIRYSREAKNLAFAIICQLPKVFRRLKQEHHWLKEAVKQHKIDIVISDNRPGLYHLSVSSIYLTHQLAIQAGNGFFSRIAQRLHYRYINKFSECWVPDAEGNINLAGKLSHPQKLPKTPVTYLGPLSRFEKKETRDKKYDLLFLLSGPEPQRTIFEEKILQQLKTYQGKAVLVRGLPGNKAAQLVSNKDLEIYDHLPAAELNDIILKSTLVISRSGYTTVMDLIKLQQPSVLVPTPGQTEQEYLAEYLLRQKICYSVKQEHFDLDKLIQEVKTFRFSIPAIDETYQQVIRNWSEKL